MAQASRASEPVEQFAQLIPVLIDAAGTYAAAGQADPELEGDIRRLKVLTAGLLAALNAIRT